ncbi:MAG: hypothetical protein JW727_02495 [Candidatus Aenigmarchaeota archaeon]|nr:hypothetical protein [Candidatus Aenigmarchaeota archaeon]
MQKAKSAKKINSAKFKTDFSKYLEHTEKKYNEQVTVLLRAIDKAEKEGDTEKLKVSKGISESWIAYFDVVKGVLKKSAKKDKAGLKIAAKFLDDQIKFFKLLSKELDKKIKEGKANKIRKSLE